jgi:hypothetical protein
VTVLVQNDRYPLQILGLLQERKVENGLNSCARTVKNDCTRFCPDDKTHAPQTEQIALMTEMLRKKWIVKRMRGPLLRENKSAKG